MLPLGNIWLLTGQIRHKYYRTGILDPCLGFEPSNNDFADRTVTQPGHTGKQIQNVLLRQSPSRMSIHPTTFCPQQLVKPCTFRLSLHVYTLSHMILRNLFNAGPRCYGPLFSRWLPLSQRFLYLQKKKVFQNVKEHGAARRCRPQAPKGPAVFRTALIAGSVHAANGEEGGICPHGPCVRGPPT